MKKKIFITVAFVAAIVFTGKLYAQEAKVKATYDLKSSSVCRVISTKTGCNIIFNTQEAESKKTTSTKSSFAFAVSSTDGGITAMDDWDEQSKKSNSGMGSGKVSLQDFHFTMQKNKGGEIIDCPVVNGVCTLPEVEDGDYTCNIVCALDSSTASDSSKAKPIKTSLTITILEGQLHSISEKGTGTNHK